MSSCWNSLRLDSPLRSLERQSMPAVIPPPSRVEVIGNELAVTWGDGQESFIELEKLRRNCPCATCGGEPDVLGNQERPRVSYGPHSFELRAFKFVGGYAFQPTWNDGHETGLYTFPLLRALGT
jgi:DUF971 family protein